MSDSGQSGEEAARVKNDSNKKGSVPQYTALLLCNKLFPKIIRMRYNKSEEENLRRKNQSLY